MHGTLGGSEARMLGFWPPLPADLAPSSLSCCSGPSSCSGLLFHPTHRQVRGTGGNPTVGPRRESWGHLAITNLPLLQLCALRRRAQPLCLSEGGRAPRMLLETLPGTRDRAASSLSLLPGHCLGAGLPSYSTHLPTGLGLGQDTPGQGRAPSFAHSIP